MQIMNSYLTSSILGDIFGWIGAVVIVIFLFGLVMVLVRRDAHRREAKSAGIGRAAGMNTQQNFALNTEDLDLDALCDQPRVRAIMNDAERAILKAYAGGETEGELAGRLLIPRSEAELQISELFARLEVNNRAELLKKLQEMLREEE
ncbi:MAG: hypothetical protein IJK77_03420 [Lachnospiraceae bacterium]|nr:hypothetical protein [Lachnospiraceae bacterium]